MAVGSRTFTYAGYLRINDLLGLQHRLSEAHDELQFILVHQVFELWFKLLLHELVTIRAAIRAGELPTANHLLRRTHEILKILIETFPIIETIRPLDFLEFRSVLGNASGFQSRQFREIEFVSGSRDERYVKAIRDDLEAQEALQARLAEPTLWDVFVELLARSGLPTETDEQIVRSLVKVSTDPSYAPLNALVEKLLEYDLLFAHWRCRHVLMVERMIGMRPGTGQSHVAAVTDGAGSYGSGANTIGSGSEYLKSTVSKRFFPLLWQSRTFVERQP